MAAAIALATATYIILYRVYIIDDILYCMLSITLLCALVRQWCPQPSVNQNSVAAFLCVFALKYDTLRSAENYCLGKTQSILDIISNIFDIFGIKYYVLSTIVHAYMRTTYVHN